MNLELLILKPEKITVSDNFIIGTTMLHDGPEKDNEEYDSLMENSYAVDPDEIDLFEDHPTSIYFHSGWWVKATLVNKVVIPCHETIGQENSGLPSLTMNQICQKFADQYYMCDKFFWKSTEFIDFIGDLVSDVTNLGSDDLDVVAKIETEIVKKLNDNGLFVHFNLT